MTDDKQNRKQPEAFSFSFFSKKYEWSFYFEPTACAMDLRKLLELKAQNKGLFYEWFSCSVQRLTPNSAAALCLLFFPS